MCVLGPVWYHTSFHVADRTETLGPRKHSNNPQCVKCRFVTKTANSFGIGQKITSEQQDKIYIFLKVLINSQAWF